MLRKRSAPKGKFEVPVKKLRWRCDPNDLCFESTAEITPLQEFVGQDRAIHAIEFGLSLTRPGYNIFVSGLTGTGRMSVIQAYIEKLMAEKLPEASDGLRDWCYVHNFAAPDKPRVVSLPKGGGRILKTEMELLLDATKREVAKVFSSEDYENQCREITDKGQRVREKVFRGVDEEAKAKGFDIRPSQLGVAAVPLDKEGKPIGREDYLALSEEERRDCDERQSELMKRVQEAVEQSRVIEKETAEQVEALDNKVAEHTVTPLFGPLLARYESHGDVTQLLEGAKLFVLEHAELLRVPEPDKGAAPPTAGTWPANDKDLDLVFRVNVFVDNSETKGLPTVAPIANTTPGTTHGKNWSPFIRLYAKTPCSTPQDAMKTRRK